VDQYRTEEEQVEALGRWWAENSRSVIAGVVLALAGSFGWQYWQGHQQQQSESASTGYQQLLKLVEQVDQDASKVDELIVAANSLKNRYGSSTYGQFAALQLARLAAVEGNLTDAEAELRWVLSHNPEQDVRRVAELRLARVLASAGDIDGGLAIIEAASANSDYQANYAIARGDMLLMAGRDEEAKAAFERAAQLLAASGNGSSVPQMLTKKLDSLSPVQPASKAKVADSAADLEEARPDA